MGLGSHRLAELEPGWPPVELVDAFVFDDIAGATEFKLGDEDTDDMFFESLDIALDPALQPPFEADLYKHSQFVQLPDGTEFMWFPATFASDARPSWGVPLLPTSRAHDAVRVYWLDRNVLKTGTVPATQYVQSSNLRSSQDATGAGTAVRFVPGFLSSAKHFNEDPEVWDRLLDVLSEQSGGMRVAFLDYMTGHLDRTQSEPYNEVFLQDGRLAAIDNSGTEPFFNLMGTWVPYLSGNAHVQHALQNKRVLPEDLQDQINTIAAREAETVNHVCDFHRSYMENTRALHNKGLSDNHLVELGTCLFFAKIDAIQEDSYRLVGQDRLGSLFESCLSQVDSLALCAAE